MTSRRYLVWCRVHRIYSIFDTRGAAEEFADRSRQRYRAARVLVLPVRQVLSATDVRANEATS